MRQAVAAALVGVAALVLAAATSTAYGLAVEYGAGVLEGGGWVVLVLGPAVLALLCLLGARPVARSGPRTPVLALGVLVVFAATVWGAGAYGGTVHDRDRAAQAAACSPEDVALLAAVDVPGPRSEVMGSCSVLVSGVPDATRATQDVVSALERGGWRLVGREGDEQVLERGDAVLRLSAASDGKATDVRLTLR